MTPVKGLFIVYLLLRVGCDGVLGSDKRADKCGVCGGDDTTCHIISGIFTRRRLPYGYNKVTTIPAGACHINITEMQPSGNYLALKLTNGGYTLNGNWALGYSNDYQGAGAVFKYHRPLPQDSHSPLEYIVAEGPTNDSLDIMLLKQQDNRGVLYSYTIPMDKYSLHKGNEEPYIRHATPPTEPRFISKEQYTSQVAAQGSGEDQKVAAQEAGDVKEEPQHDEQGMTYQQRYQAYLARLRDKQQQPVYPIDDRGASVAQSRQTGTAPLPTRGNSDYEARLRALRIRERAKEHRRQERLRQQQEQQRKEQRHEQQRQRELQERSRIAPQSGSQLRGPDAVPQPAPGINYGRQTPGQVAPQPGINYGVSSNSQPKPGRNFGVPSNPNLVPNVQQPPAQVIPLQPVYPKTGQIPPVYPQSQGNYYSGQNSGYLQGQHRQPYPNSQAQKFLPPNINYQAPQYPQQYNPGYNQYQGNLGQVQPQLLGGAVNDQISLTLPGSNRQPRLGIVDTTADYSWKITGFTECTRKCGEGEQSTVTVCVKVNSQAIVTDENCDNAIKPDTQSIPCNTLTCPPDWDVGEWGACSTSCDRGKQTRTTECKQRVSRAVQLSVSASRCQHLPKPSIIKACNEDKPCMRWKVDQWTECSSECGRGRRTRAVVCVNAAEQPVPENACTGHKPRSQEICDMGSCAKTWFYTEWSTECSSDCGQGVFTREVYCSADNERCRSIDKPDTERTCRSDIPCGGQWFTGPWGKCTVTCGVGAMKREVTCIKHLGNLLAVVDDENCLSHEKPDSEQLCQRPQCQPQWYRTDWTECSKSCNTGFKTREVKCLTQDKRSTNVCDQTNKPESREICNTLKCPTSRTEPGCTDKFKNCLLVVQARLCSYNYYKNNCCLSCTSHDEHHHHHDT